MGYPISLRTPVMISKDHHSKILQWIKDNNGMGTITRFVELAIDEKLQAKEKKVREKKEITNPGE